MYPLLSLVIKEKAEKPEMWGNLHSITQTCLYPIGKYCFATTDIKVKLFVGFSTGCNRIVVSNIRKMHAHDNVFSPRETWYRHWPGELGSWLHLDLTENKKKKIPFSCNSEIAFLQNSWIYPYCIPIGQSYIPALCMNISRLGKWKQLVEQSENWTEALCAGFVILLPTLRLKMATDRIFWNEVQVRIIPNISILGNWFSVPVST